MDSTHIIDKDNPRVCKMVCPIEQECVRAEPIHEYEKRMLEPHLCTGWCVPLYIHFAFSVVQAIVITQMKIYNQRLQRYTALPLAVRLRYLTFTTLWNIIIGIVIYYLCRTCHQGWSWVILLLPVILNLVMMLLLLAVIGLKKLL